MSTCKQITRTEMGQTQDVDGPNAPILDDYPKLLRCQTLAVMHVRLGRIVPENAVNHDRLLAATHLGMSLQTVKMDGLLIANRSLNQPLGRNHVFVCVGLGGIMKKDVMPIMSVRRPSIKNRYRHPARPSMTFKRRMPDAMNAPEISAT